MLVKNRRGTADLTCPCGQWLRHWERSMGRAACRCGAADCTARAEVGAHVLALGGLLPVKGVVPLCSRCNHREDEFQAREPLAPVGRQSFCG